MAKRVYALLSAVLLLLGTLILPVCAAEPSEPAEAGNTVVSAYYRQGDIYVFLDPAKEGIRSVTVSVDGNVVGEKLSPSLASGERLKTEYLLVVDTSEEISQGVICGLAGGLLAASAQEITVSMAAYGSEFQLIDTGMTEERQIWAAENALEYGPSNANILTGLTEAINYLRSEPRPVGQLTSVVLISTDPAITAEQPEASDAAYFLNTVLENSPDIVLHTVYVDPKAAAGTEDLTPRKSSYAIFEDNTSAYEVGASICRSADGLCWVSCQAPGVEDAESCSVTLILTNTYGDTQTLSLSGVPNLDKTSGLELPPAAEPEAETQETTVETTQEPSEETTAPTEVPTEVPTEETPTEETLTEAETTEAPAEPTEEEERQEEPISLGQIVWYCVGAMGVVIAVLLLLLLRGRNQTAAGRGAGIPVRMEVITGKCRNPRQKLFLSQELTVGSDPACDIVWKEASVSLRHCRIFVRNNLIWLEDLNERSNTWVEGTKIYAPICLHSEDEIRLGEVRFKLLF